MGGVFDVAGWEEGEQHPCGVSQPADQLLGCAESPLCPSCCTEIPLPSTQEMMRHISRVLGELVQAIPPDMDQERAKLVLAMLLAKKIMNILNTVPSLLRRVYNTTANFMHQQFHDYIADMVSPAALGEAQPAFFSCPGLFPEG